MYNYLATLRLHDGDGGRTLTVGPKRRVVFKNRIVTPLGQQPRRYSDLRKDELKRVLAPLKQWWGEDDPAKRHQDSGRPLMSFTQFKGLAKVLLREAGMLRDLPVED